MFQPFDRAQEFEITLVFNGYKNGPSLRLRIKVARVHVLVAAQKNSGLWGRD